MMLDSLSVSELLQQMKQTINQDEQLQNVALIGEVSNFSAHRSGHFYFNLKDEKARIACVMFRSRAGMLRFRPKDGDKVVLVGRVDVFEASGSVQFYTEKMILDGLGQLHQQYELLKERYFKLGAFDQERKKSIPSFPKRMGIITGAHSAAHADMHRTIQERWPLVESYDLLSLVQGEDAKHQLAQRIHEAQKMSLDIIILARGGGSIEDLWAFNEPEVIDAILQSQIPIITGIGHESDTTLSDLVSDYRAATPTAAIVAALPSQIEIKQKLRDYKNQYYLAVRNKLQAQKQNYTQMTQRTVLMHPERLFDKHNQLLDYYRQHLSHGLKRFDQLKMDLNNYHHQFETKLTQKFLNTQLQLDQMQKQNDLNIHQQLNKSKQELHVLTIKHEYTLQRIERLVKLQQEHVQDYNPKIIKLIQDALKKQHKAFRDTITTLNHLSPLNIMAKGYALTYQNDTIIKSIDDLKSDEIRVQYQDGHLDAKVIRKEKHHE